ncbi:MAG: 3-hydroxyacyl-CoA dehydrogenase NAD-binding domain-containing protein [Chloroflexota bacterium]|nr:3-hydroxyacyl-CoA dehydrogenase NAD-binding domain-containing protein [Chloroflexota bacterium]
MSPVVGVVGAGTMGAGIAQVCLVAGHEVVLYDVDEQALARGRSRIVDGLDRLVARGRLTDDDRRQALAGLHDAVSLDAVAAGADVVIEAALEDLELKRTVFRALGAAAPSDALLATNTSALSVTSIGEASGRPGTSLGLHFFNPAPLMPLVEVVAGSVTTADTIERAVRFIDGLGKTPVVCRDEPGFIVNRVNRPFTLEALRMLEAAEAAVEQIDGAIVGAGYPMGPLALMDLVGIDVNYAVARALWDAFGGAVRFAPSPIQQRLLEAGRLGRKSGEGFYAYEDGRTVVSPRLAEVGVVAPHEGGLPADEIVARIELAIINEAYHAIADRVADAADIDRAMKLGANHPHGPFERAGQLGLRAVIDGLARFEALHGERYRVAGMLWQMASL